MRARERQQATTTKEREGGVYVALSYLLVSE